MYQVTFIFQGFLFNITTPDVLSASILRRITKHSRLWKIEHKGQPRLVF